MHCIFQALSAVTRRPLTPLCPSPADRLPLLAKRRKRSSIGISRSTSGDKGEVLVTRFVAVVALSMVSSIALVEAHPRGTAQDSSSCPPETRVQVSRITDASYKM